MMFLFIVTHRCEGVTSFGRKVLVNGNGPTGISGGPKNHEKTFRSKRYKRANTILTRASNNHNNHTNK
jgi:hypothetical protein